MSRPYLPLTRRTFLAASAATVTAAGAGVESLPGILARIRDPRIPTSRVFDITRYGAREADATEGIRRAIAACSAAGGGRVVVPAGVFSTGPIHLRSKVDLHLAQGATLRFVRDPKAYLPLVFTRWEGTELMNYSPLIYAFEQTDIAVTGEGTLDGGADETHWWPWKGRGGNKTENQAAARAKLIALADKDVPVAERVFGEGAFLRPQFVQPYRCQNVLIEGVTIVNSPMWEIHPVLCRNVTVRGVTINTHGPNNDGCDPESSTDVLIDKCTFDTGDDCIAIKSGRNRDGRRVAVPCQNIVVRNSTMRDGHGGVTIGSEASGGVRNVFVEQCTMDSPHLERALRLKSNSHRGGVIENVHFRNVTIGQVSGAIVDIDLYYEEGPGGPHPPTVRDIFVENVTSKKSKHGVYLRGYPDAPIRNVQLRNCRFENVARGNVTENVEGFRMDPAAIP